MPTYEYACKNGHHFEEFQSIVAAPIEVCPVCGASAERLISGGTGLIFRGSGFYITDYARKGGGGEAKETKILSDKAKSSDGPSSKPQASTATPSTPTSSPGSKE